MSRDVELIVVPYDTGLRLERMGRGPQRMLDAGLVQRLTADGHRVNVRTVETRCRFRVEAQVAVDLAQQVAEAAAGALARGALPLVLSGNCNSALGTMAALGRESGAVWFDAHGDFNTPETSPSGYFDGMALAVATGRCWRTLASTISGFAPTADRDVVLVGARDLDPGERALLDASQVTWIRADGLRAGDATAFEAGLAGLASRVRRVYLHLDLDVHDPADAPANTYAAPQGLSRAQVQEAVARICARFQVAAAALAAYDPSVDPDGRTAEAGIQLARAVASRGAGPS